MYTKSSINRFGSYQLVSEPSILGFGGVDQKMKKKAMEEEEELELLHEDVAALNKDFTALNKEMKRLLSTMKNFMNGSKITNENAIHGIQKSSRGWRSCLEESDDPRAKIRDEAYPLAKLQEQVISRGKGGDQPSSSVGDGEFKVKASNSCIGKFSTLSSHQSKSSMDVVSCESHISGDCNEIGKHHTVYWEENLTEINEPHVFDKMPQRLIGEQLQVFDEVPKSDYIELEAQVLLGNDLIASNESPEIKFEISTDCSKVNDARSKLRVAQHLSMQATNCLQVLSGPNSDPMLSTKDYGEKLLIHKSLGNQELDLKSSTMMKRPYSSRVLLLLLLGTLPGQKQTHIMVHKLVTVAKSKSWRWGGIGNSGVNSLSKEKPHTYLKFMRQRQTPLPLPEPPPQQLTMTSSTAVLEDKDCFKGGSIVTCQN